MREERSPAIRQRPIKMTYIPLPKVRLMHLEHIYAGHCKECRTHNLPTTKESSRGFGNSFSDRKSYLWGKGKNALEVKRIPSLVRLDFQPAGKRGSREHLHTGWGERQAGGGYHLLQHLTCIKPVLNKEGVRMLSNGMQYLHSLCQTLTMFSNNEPWALLLNSCILETNRLC